MNRLVLALAFLLPVSSAMASTVGEKAPAFKAMDLAGKPFEFKGAEGGVTLVNFWATWCAPCASEFPELNKLAAEYKGSVKVFAISLDEGDQKTKIEKWLAKRNPGPLAIKVLYDKEEKSAEDYNVSAMPTTFIIDKTGTIRFVHTGFSPEDAPVWRKEIQSLR